MNTVAHRHRAARPIRHIAGAAGPPISEYDADIIILALDRAEETVSAIASALGQLGVSRHVFILDQGSRESTLALLAEAVAGRGDATLVSTGANLGVAEGRNIAASLGHGRVIVGLDNDANFDGEQVVSHMVSALDNDASVAALGCRIVVASNGADDLSSWGYPPTLLPHAHQTWDAATFVGAGHAIRRTAWDAAGGYDPALFFCWEEFDFSLRAIALGWRIRYCGDLIIRHKVCAEQRVAWSDRRWFFFVRNRIYIGIKYREGLFRLLPRLGAYALRGFRRGQARQTIRALAAAWGLAGTIKASRMPRSVRDYLWWTDGVHQDRLVRRLGRELLLPLDDRIAGAIGPPRETPMQALGPIRLESGA